MRLAPQRKEMVLQAQVSTVWMEGSLDERQEESHLEKIKEVEVLEVQTALVLGSIILRVTSLETKVKVQPWEPD